MPVSAVAYGYLKLVSLLQGWLFQFDSRRLGFHGPPVWWPVPLLAIAGLLVSSTIKYLPGTAGHSPADGFQTGGTPEPIDLPGVVVASLATLSLGVVLGPEAPLIAIGGILGVIAVSLARREAPPTATDGHGRGGQLRRHQHPVRLTDRSVPSCSWKPPDWAGPMLGLVLVPGLLAAGVGTLIFVGLELAQRVRYLLAGHPRPPAVPAPDRLRCSCGRWSSAWSPRWVARSSI